MKSTSKKIILISLCLFFAGVIFAIIGLSLGGQSGFLISKAGIRSISSEATSYELPKTKLSDFSKAELSLDYGTIDICPSDDKQYYLEYQLYGSSGKPSYGVNNNTFSIQQQDDSFSFMVWGLFPWKSTSVDPYIRLYVPEDKILEMLKLSAESGSVDIDTVNADTVTMDVTYGDVKIEKSMFSSLSFISESTEMKLKDSSVDNFELEGQYGDVSLENFTCDSAMINLDSSDVYLDAAKLEHLDYLNEYGAITLKLPEGMDMYSFDISIEYGDIRLPDDAPGGYRADDDSKESYKTKGKGSQTIKMESESGDVDIQKR